MGMRLEITRRIHKYLQKLGAQEIRQQVEACNQAVAAITGEAPKTVRLPGGGKNSTVLANISQPIVLLECGYAGLEDAQCGFIGADRVKPGKKMARWF